MSLESASKLDSHPDDSGTIAVTVPPVQFQDPYPLESNESVDDNAFLPHSAHMSSNLRMKNLPDTLKEDYKLQRARAPLECRDWCLRPCVLGLPMQITLLLLLIADCTVLFYGTAEGHYDEWALDTNLAILGCFTLELVLRIAARGCMFWRDIWSYVDLVTISISWSILILIVTRNDHGVSDLTTLKIFYFAPRTLATLRPLFKIESDSAIGARRCVGGYKRRFVDPQRAFDLDLSYIAPELIAMGVPAHGCNGLYRNPQSEVVRFFQVFHHEHFKIYNCCPEMPYDTAQFSERVFALKIQDHTPPKLYQIIEFLEDAGRWINAHDANVIAVHCKAGKGRTGTLCCSWLIYSLNCEDDEEALMRFAECRSDLRHSGHLQGVDTPSQKRYIHYVHMMLKAQNNYLCSSVAPHIPAPPARKMNMLRLRLNGIFRLTQKASRLLIVVVEVAWKEDPSQWTVVFESEPVGAAGTPQFDLHATEVENDVRITVFDQSKRDPDARVHKAGDEPGALFYFIFHTALEKVDAAGEISVPTTWLDKACKDVHQLKYDMAGRAVLSVSQSEVGNDGNANEEVLLAVPAESASDSRIVVPQNPNDDVDGDLEDKALPSE